MLVRLHWLFAALAKRLRRRFAFRNDKFATLVKGKERVLIRDGEIQWSAMRKSHIGERDLLGALRSEANVTYFRQEAPAIARGGFIEHKGRVPPIV